MEGFTYLVGGLHPGAERPVSTAAKKKAPEPDSAEAPAAAVAAQERGPARRRRLAKVKMLGRGYEYMDLEPDTEASPEGPFGFTGTATRQAAAAPGGLATLAGDAFGGSSTTPMIPGTWRDEPHDS
jgi:hypothetical protein